MLESEEKRIVAQLETTEPTSKEYAVLLARLKDIREVDKTSFNLKSPLMIQAYTSLLGIASILLFERNGIITSKALNFIKK
jgi:hypothetical protein